MATKILIVCATALFVQFAAAGHSYTVAPKVIYGLGGGSAAASSAASAAASRNAAAASAAAAAAASGGRGASAASAAAAAAAAGRGGAASSSAAAAAAAAAAGAASARSAGAGSAITGWSSDYDIIYSGPLLVTSTSPIYPSGLYVSSDNTLQGPLHVAGTMPFLSAVSFDGTLPTEGSGIATCGCGSDNIGIIEEL